MSKWLGSGVFSAKKVPRSYAEAVESLEQTAVGSKGSALLTTISDWCNALESMRQTGLGSINCPDEDFPYKDGTTLQYPWVNFISPNLADNARVENNAINKSYDFRSIFLRSNALEKLLKNCLLDSHTCPDVWPVLERLLRVCLESGAASVSPLNIGEKLRCLYDACSVHNTKIAASRDDLVDVIVTAVGVVKIHADIEDLDSHIVAVKSDKTGAAPFVTSRDMESPVSTSKLPEKLRTARQEWEKGCVLWKLVRLRNSLFEKGLQREADYDDMYRLLQSQLSQVQESHTSLSEKIVQTEVDYEDQIFKRDKQMDELKEKVGAAQKEVMRLQLEKQRLEKLLQAVTTELEAAEEHCAEVTEDLSVYEEGENLHLDGMMHQSNELREEEEHHSGEERALGVAQGIVEHLHKLLSEHASKGMECAKSLKETSEQEWLSSGRDYCSNLRDEVHLLIRQARFCQKELSYLSNKQGQISEIGMQSMMIDVDRSWINTRQKFLQARASVGSLLQESHTVKNQMMELSETDDHSMVKPNESEHSAMFIYDSFYGQDGNQAPSGCNPLVTNSAECQSEVSYFPVPELSSIFGELCNLQAEYESLIETNMLGDGSTSDSSFESVNPETLSNLCDPGGANNNGLCDQ